VLFASGRGSNVASILSAVASGELNAKVLGIICNIEGAGVLEVAAKYNVPAFVIPHKGLDREAHEALITEKLAELSPDYLVLAGYMRLFSSQFITAQQPANTWRIVNIHPSLLPAFPGVNSYQQAFDYGVQVAGVTVHFVTPEMDAGPIISQLSFDRDAEDTLQVFTQKGLALEHCLYPSVLKALVYGRVNVQESPAARHYCTLSQPLTLVGV
jgi:formyltetrahydrofolate-dependent phosphoribosylglycinamide formyltransferase